MPSTYSYAAMADRPTDSEWLAARYCGESLWGCPLLACALRACVCLHVSEQNFMYLPARLWELAMGKQKPILVRRGECLKVYFDASRAMPDWSAARPKAW